MGTKYTLVILGASGDLAGRLLFPALYRLEASGHLPELAIVGQGLEEWGEAQFRQHVRERVSAHVEAFRSDVWERFAKRLGYRSGKLEAEALRPLADLISGPAVFYLALPPGLFAKAASALGELGLAREDKGARRLVIEKPFGEDLETARALNREVHTHWREPQILRIDHFLGKETVQNLLVFRFANRFLEPVLNSQHIAQVQITVAETLGLEGRYRYYDGIGALRDMVQNHLMQLFNITAIEPPAEWDAEVLRSHKVEVLRAVHPIAQSSVGQTAVRGRYRAGRIGDEKVPGYLDEPGIPDSSRTETFAALRLELDTWRWKGVPFYLRTGKRLARDVSEIALQFREPPTRLFANTALAQAEPNWLVFRLKPEESMDLVVQAKHPGLALEARSVVLHASYARAGEPEVSAYEQLLLDALEGDAAPFLRFDEVERSWELLDPVLRAWESGEPEPYDAGSDGPRGQRAILRPGHQWRPIGEAV